MRSVANLDNSFILAGIPIGEIPTQNGELLIYDKNKMQWITATAGGGGGLITGATNIGGGCQIFKQTVAGLLELRTINVSTNLICGTAVNTVDLDVASIQSNIQQISSGTGETELTSKLKVGEINNGNALVSINRGIFIQDDGTNNNDFIIAANSNDFVFQQSDTSTPGGNYRMQFITTKNASINVNLEMDNNGAVKLPALGPFEKLTTPSYVLTYNTVTKDIEYVAEVLINGGGGSISFNNLGTGEEVYKSSNNNNVVEFRTLIGQSPNILITNTNDELIFDTPLNMYINRILPRDTLNITMDFTNLVGNGSLAFSSNTGFTEIGGDNLTFSAPNIRFENSVINEFRMQFENGPVSNNDTTLKKTGQILELEVSNTGAGETAFDLRNVANVILKGKSNSPNIFLPSIETATTNTEFLSIDGTGEVKKQTIIQPGLTPYKKVIQGTVTLTPASNSCIFLTIDMSAAVSGGHYTIKFNAGSTIDHCQQYIVSVRKRTFGWENVLTSLEDREDIGVPEELGLELRQATTGDLEFKMIYTNGTSPTIIKYEFVDYSLEEAITYTTNTLTFADTFSPNVYDSGVENVIFRDLIGVEITNPQAEDMLVFRNSVWQNRPSNNIFTQVAFKTLTNNSVTMVNQNQWYSLGSMFPWTQPTNEPSGDWFQSNGTITLQKLGVINRWCHITYTISMGVNSDGQEYEFSIFKNGAVIDRSIFGFKNGSNNDAHLYNMDLLEFLNTSDNISIRVRCISSAGRIATFYNILFLAVLM